MSEHKIEVSPSGRATCRSCKELIAKDVLRFGNAVPDTFSGAGFRLEWNHLECAAKRFPDAVVEALAKYEGDVPERDKIDSLIATANTPNADGTGGGRGGLPTADRAPTGRAKCAQCDNAIEKDSVRINVERAAESGSFAGKSYLHPACAAAWVVANFPEGMEPFRKRIDANTSMKLAEIPAF